MNIVKDTFTKYWNIAETIPGWMNKSSYGYFNCFFDFQFMQHYQGDILELGTYYGRSASTYIYNIHNQEKIYLVDSMMTTYLDNLKINLSKFGNIANITYFDGDSNKLLDQLDNKKLFHKMRFIHIDANHVAQYMFNDIKTADNLLLSNGILAIDDFFNFLYPELTECIYNYLFLNPYNFKIFFVAANKAYLCRPEYFSQYYNYTLKYLPKNMLSIGLPIQINKSSSLGDCLSLSAFDSNELKARGDDKHKLIDIITSVNESSIIENI